MSTCPECAQILPPEAHVCPACGHDLHTRRLAEPVPEHDPEASADDLLAAVIADEGVKHRPPWVPPLEDRLAPNPNAKANASANDDKLADVIPDPATVSRRRGFFRRR